MDYRLKALYEQMHQEKVVKQTNTSQPKTLKEAYDTIIAERAVFYSKEIKPDEVPPDFKNLGLQILGDVENPEKIKHAITSYSLIKPLEQLLKDADEAGRGWHKPPVVGVNLNNLAQEFVALGVIGGDVATIVQYKNQLTDLESAIKSLNEFNMRDIVVGNLKKINLASSGEILNSLFDFLFKMTASIALASTGAGEIAATVLTNAKKGETGDLVFGKTKVEIKGLTGRLGKAGYAWKNTATGLANFLSSLQTKTTGKETESTLKYKNSIKKSLLKIQNNETLHKHLDPSYYQMIMSIVNERNLHKIENTINKSQVLSIPSRQFLQKFIKDTEPNFPLSPTPPPKTATDFFVTQNNNIKINLKSLLASAAEQDGFEDILHPTSLSKQNYNSAIRRFFLNDIGLTAEQAAEAFTRHAKTEDINGDTAMSVYGPVIASFFKAHYESMKNGNSRLLEALIFGYSLAIYAKKDGSADHFNYFLMVNDNTQEAIAIDTSISAGQIVLNAANLFLSNKKFSLSIRADERGGSAISFGPRPKGSKDEEE